MVTWTVSLLVLLSIPLSYSFNLTSFPDPVQLLSDNSEIKKLFGESCNETSGCLHPFICTNDLCSCPPNRLPHPHNNRIWSPYKRVTCDIPIGQTCNTFPQLKTFAQVSKLGDMLWTKLGLGSKGEDCVPNGRCDGRNCVCNPGFYRKEGHCALQRAMFQQCNKRDEECQESLVCNKQRSRCECPDHLTFDIRSLKCHVAAGASCDAFSSSTPTCVPNSDCLEGHCNCNFGFRRDSDGSCALDYGLPCDQDYSCSDLDLVCRSGRCVCKYFAHQYFDDDREECIGKVSAPCDLIQPQKNEIGSANITGTNETRTWVKGLRSVQRCTEHASCVEVKYPGGQRSECRCKETYGEDSEGKCVKSYGASCEGDGDCDQVAQLVCLNAKCSCPDQLQVFDFDVRRCSGLVGSRCSSNLTKIAEFRERAVPTHCVPNAFCEEKVEGLDGRCTCKVGYQTNAIRHCQRKSSKFIYH